MSKEAIVSILIGIPIGILSGLYAGLVVARYQRFADLRLQVRRIILEIDFIAEDHTMFFPQRKEVPEFSIISSDFFFLGHKVAGLSILQLANDIRDIIVQATTGKISYEVFSKHYGDWQSQARALYPSTWQIVRLWGGL